MQSQRNNQLIYTLLLAVWALVMIWQVEEHVRVRNAARAALENRAGDIANTIGIVLRSQRRFGVFVNRERLEDSLTNLVKQGSQELSGIALLNAAGGIVASNGAVDLQNGSAPAAPEVWSPHTATFFSLVDLGTNLARDIESPIIMSRQEFTTDRGTNRMGRPPPPEEPPPGPPPGEPPPEGAQSNLTSAAEMPPPPNGATNGRPYRVGRPPWMSEEKYQELQQEKGARYFVIVMSTQAFAAACEQDLWLRLVIGVLATISAVGSGVAWRNMSKSAELQIRLIRASELNTHLKEMNLAAAGLAHETRNPLNIIRGLAQMISKQNDAPSELREKSRAIVDETDKVTAQLNEFINYSRPREVRRSRVALLTAANEVVRTLAHDIQEKQLRVETGGDPVTVEADEQLLRQVLFNLLLNAIQAVGPAGQIRIIAQRLGATEAALEVRDDGPGVPPDRRQEIFKPYFTTNQKGTGLGLAVVQQIILAHGWEIECLANEPKGARFRITHLRMA
ncbi:MAG: ATP-binding protein [Verrucomicrobiota bacterium]|jgi:signal transduction histidine kinase